MLKQGMYCLCGLCSRCGYATSYDVIACGRCGYATLHDVIDKSHEDRMESFFLSETCKYLYLVSGCGSPWMVTCCVCSSVNNPIIPVCAAVNNPIIPVCAALLITP